MNKYNKEEICHNGLHIIQFTGGLDSTYILESLLQDEKINSDNIYLIYTSTHNIDQFQQSKEKESIEKILNYYTNKYRLNTNLNTHLISNIYESNIREIIPYEKRESIDLSSQALLWISNIFQIVAEIKTDNINIYNGMVLGDTYSQMDNFTVSVKELIEKLSFNKIKLNIWYPLRHMSKSNLLLNMIKNNQLAVLELITFCESIECNNLNIVCFSCETFFETIRILLTYNNFDDKTLNILNKYINKFNLSIRICRKVIYLDCKNTRIENNSICINRPLMKQVVKGECVNYEEN